MEKTIPDYSLGTSSITLEVQESIRKGCCQRARKSTRTSMKRNFLPSPPFLAWQNTLFPCPAIISPLLSSGIFCVTKPFVQAQSHFKGRTTKGVLGSYQSCLASKPLHSAASVTYFRSECTACPLKGPELSNNRS